MAMGRTSAFFVVAGALSVGCAPAPEKVQHKVGFTQVMDNSDGAGENGVVGSLGIAPGSGLDNPRLGTFKVVVVGHNLRSYSYVFGQDQQVCDYSLWGTEHEASTPMEIEINEAGTFYLCLLGKNTSGQNLLAYEGTYTVNLDRPSLMLTQKPATASGREEILMGVYSPTGKTLAYSFGAGAECGEFKDHDLGKLIPLKLASKGEYTFCARVMDGKGQSSDVVSYSWTYFPELIHLGFTGLPYPADNKSSYRIGLASESEMGSLRYGVSKGENGCSTDALTTSVSDEVTSLVLSGNNIKEGVNTLCLQGLSTDGVLTEFVTYHWLQKPSTAFAKVNGLPGETVPVGGDYEVTFGDAGDIVSLRYALLASHDVPCQNAVYSPVNGSVEFTPEVGVYTFCGVGILPSGEASDYFSYKFSVVVPTNISSPKVAEFKAGDTNQAVWNGLLIKDPSTYQTYNFGLAQGDVECDSVTYSSDRVGADSFDINLDMGDGPYTLCVKGVAVNGFVTDGRKYLLNLNTQKPDFDLGNFQGTLPANTETHVFTVDTAASFYQFAHLSGADGDCANAIYSSPIPTSADLSVVVMPGPQTLCVKVEDSLGNMSDVKEFLFSKE